MGDDKEEIVSQVEGEMAPQDDDALSKSSHFKERELLIAPEGMKCIGINGYWYNVTNFIPRHPGGEIIKKFVGKDATSVFRAFRHGPHVLKHRKPVGTYNVQTRHPADKDFENLIETCERLGYYETTWSFYIKKIVVILALLWSVFYLVIYCHDSWYHRILAGMMLTIFWQQVAFNLHDLMHTQVFRKRKWDRITGTVVGTVGFGMSAHWWQDEHIEHHSMTNTVDVENKWIDPQMWESVWAQNEKMFPMFTTLLHRLAIRFQHITFVPVVIIFGRVAILIDSYSQERRWYEWLAIFTHWCWMLYLLSWLPTWSMVFQVYGAACITEGLLHFQLILSHYVKEFIDIKEYHETSWYVYMVSSTMNIDNYWWTDWFHGGLNFHIEHHLFPKLARKHLRTIAPEVERICVKHGIKYEKCSFWYLLAKTLKHLKRSSSHYNFRAYANTITFL